MNKSFIIAYSSRLAESMVNKTSFHHTNVNKKRPVVLQIMSLHASLRRYRVDHQ